MAGTLGPWQGVYHPGYSIQIWQGGDPSQPLTSCNLRTATTIETSKSLDDISGTFSITFKDRRVQNRVKPMDTVKIKLRGHNQGWGTVLLGVVDSTEPTGTANVSSSQADVTVTGRCTAKYLQSNSMFLPVWDPLADLPTALLFGLGDASQKLGTGPKAFTPREIFGYIYKNFVVGLRNRVGLSGTPNARYWLNATNRFEWVADAGGGLFQVPFIQFDEDTCDTALTNLTVTGFTEGWVDETGNVVYRPPQWDGAVAWNLSTAGLQNWDAPSSDVAIATYVEVYPSGVLGAPTAAEQALLAGRAPIPSSYLASLKSSGAGTADPAFVVDTDGKGMVTAAGAKNWYYQKQKQYGLRPYQLTSPLLATQAQAQAQAQGLLRFMLRWQKSATITIPGEPGVRLGQTIYVHGRLDDQTITRTYYVEGVAQEYVEGDHYTTTLTLSHGRDPGDPGWQGMMLPNLTAASLVSTPGVLQPSSPAASGYPLPAGTSALRIAVVNAAVNAVGATNFQYDEIRPMPTSLTVNPCVTDCSGYATLCYKAASAPDPNGFGYNGQGNTTSLQQRGSPTSKPQPGDLAFWSNFDHVAVYLGGGQIAEFGGGSSPIQSTIAAETGNGYHTSFIGYRTYL